MENYPVYIDGAQCGSMQVYSEGLMTVFDAECRCLDAIASEIAQYFDRLICRECKSIEYVF